jgi:hypothetical protein
MRLASRCPAQLLRAGAATFALTFSGAAGSQVAEVDLRSQLFFEPSATSRMTVLAPEAGFSGHPASWLTVNASYGADIVSGASEAVKAGPLFSRTPDIVSTASVHDFRQVLGGGLTLRREHARLSAGFTHGFENDYRSNAIHVAAGADFLQRNTDIEIAYAHGFDEVCDLALNAGQHPTHRQRLESSAGCFTQATDRRAVEISIDNFQGSWTQAWTPTFATQVVGSASLQKGLLINPYRAVVVGPAGEFAQEHHPDTRSRFAIALRTKVYLKPLQTALGAGVRGYRDTWDLTSQSYELDVERNVVPALRVRAHVRYYAQTGAVFWSDDYTGGEPLAGPRGRYFSGDRELSPLKNLLGGGRLILDVHGAPGERLGGTLLGLDLSVGADVLKTFLEEFTWAGRTPDDTVAFILSLGATGAF